jgi:hypothetical protein
MRLPLVSLMTVALVAVLLSTGFPSASAAPGPSASAPHGVSAGALPPVVVHPASLQLAGPHPLQTDLYYMQEGATIGQINGSSAVSGFFSLSLQLTLRISPHPVGYELNGLSNTGDWYQIVVADNWPGCNSGFEEVTEVWDSNLVSGPVNCVANVSLSAGDVVVLGLNFTTSHAVCLLLSDVTTSRRDASCGAQPDAGGSRFIPLDGVANSNGYFTGPMTEVVNETDACPSYSDMPTIDYRGPAGDWVSQYSSWSDEFDASTFGICYSTAGTFEALSPTDLTSHFVDSAANSGFAARWGAGQNYSWFDPSFGWRFQTDPSPFGGVSISASQTEVRPGTPVVLSLSVSGAVAPYRAFWYVNGTRQATTNLTFTFTPVAEGTYPVSADAIDAANNVQSAAAPLVITAAGPLTVLSLTASPLSGGVDIGQTVTFVVSVQGGLGPRTFAWAGLPRPCASANTSQLACVPLGPGTFSVNVTVSDSNHTTVVSPDLVYIVHDTPSATLVLNRTEADVGQLVLLSVVVSGGAGPFLYDWSGTPSGCPPPTTGSMACAPIAPGTFAVSAIVTDANGALALAPTTILIVYAAPSVTLAVSSMTGEAGQTIHLSARASGGPGPLTYDWTGLPAGCSGGNVSTIDCTLAQAGTTVLAVEVVDPLGGAATSDGLLLTTYARVGVVLTVSPSAASVGGLVTFTATVAGGHGTRHYLWDGVPPSCVAPPNASFACQVEDSGAFTARVTVTDGLGVSANASANLTIAAAATGPSLYGVGWLGWALVVGAVVAIAAGVTIAARRRRTRTADGAEPVDDPAPVDEDGYR